METKLPPLVCIIMGSDSDAKKVEPAEKTLKDFGIPYLVLVLSAHRTPADIHKWAQDARADGLKVIIAAAGGAAHLPGVIAAWSTLPVIGLPISSPLMGGLDSLLSIVQMPSGIPVATVAIDAAKNAALLAIEILSVGNDEDSANLYSQLVTFRARQSAEVTRKCEEMSQLGIAGYLAKFPSVPKS